MMAANRVGIALALALGLALVVLGPATDRETATAAVPAVAAMDGAEQQIDARTLHCLREALARFAKCMREGGPSFDSCRNRADIQFNVCMGNQSPPNPD